LNRNSILLLLFNGQSNPPLTHAFSICNDYIGNSSLCVLTLVSNLRMPGAGTETQVEDNYIRQMLIPLVSARNARRLGAAKRIARELGLVLFSAELLGQQTE
jgi:hypothetical protein